MIRRSTAAGRVAPPVHRRRGVLLLVVLSMLTLFMLLGTAFLVLASRTRATSRAFLKLADDQARSSVTLRPLLRDAALQLIRGTGNGRSVIRHHDLFGDKYGSAADELDDAADDGVNEVDPAGAQVVAGGSASLLRLRLRRNTGIELCGRILTFVDGPIGVENTSARIVEAELDGADPAWSFAYIVQPAAWSANPPVTHVLINSREFAGTGFSGKSAGGLGATSLSDAALLPNRSLDLPNLALTQDAANPFTPTDAHENYDAVDEQNWALGLADGTAKSFLRPHVLQHWIESARADGIEPVDLITLAKQGTTGNDPANPTFQALLKLRRATLRPFAYDHFQDSARTTDFAGKPLTTGDLAAELAGNEGDVDNDGDGTLDSVWLDLGYSPIEFTDGKQVKPLFALHCIDLGGRININAHGSSAHVLPAAAAPEELAQTRPNGTATGATPQLKWGLGFGPADVQLDAVIASDNQSAALLGSRKASGAGDGIRRDIGNIVGRYGDTIGDAGNLPRPGRANEIDRLDGGLPGLTGSRQNAADTLDYWQKNVPTNQLGRFGGPPDYWARLAVGVDHRGHPFWVNRAGGLTESIDNPYELDLFAPRLANGYLQPASSTQAWMDEPFTAAELEAVLRPFDIDNAAALPPRALATVLSAAGDSLTRNRLLTTTMSWSTPAVVVDNPFFARADVDPDLARGLKMDLNRPFGDGSDNNGNGVVDEPSEHVDPYFASSAALARDDDWPRGFRDLQQPGVNSSLLRARQCLAYHLFNILDTLATLLAAGGPADPGLRLFAVRNDQDGASFTPEAVDPSLAADPNLSPDEAKVGEQREHNRRVLAQWAVNVVDFLDADAIMTPFRWKMPSAGPPGNQFVVWGSEYPDLMLTETLAFHDRRTADTKNDPTGKTTTEFQTEYNVAYQKWVTDRARSPYPNALDPDDDPATPDDGDFDQVRIPEGSLFLELYATRNPNLPNLPRELYSFSSGKWSLDLGRIPAGGTEPVWRLSLSRPSGTANDVFHRLAANPDTESLAPGSNPAQVADLIDINRYVWFTTAGAQASGVTPGPNQDNTFFVRGGSAPAVAPGGYLVVGPRASTSLGSKKTSGAQKWGVPSPQQIILNGGVRVLGLDGNDNPTYSPPNKTFGEPLPPPGGLPETTSVIIASNPPTPAGDTEWIRGRAGVAASGIGLNVSEPLRSNYYPCPTHQNPATGLFDAYGPLNDPNGVSFLDTPADAASGRPVYDTNMLSGGSYANFCTVFVERLADPTRPHEPDPKDPDWNPYVAIDFMPIDLTVFNGESSDQDPSETQGPDRPTRLGELPTKTESPQKPAEPVPPLFVPLPIAHSNTLAARQTYFHTRQRGFGSDLVGYENDGTLFGKGAVKRNPNPFKPIGSLADIAVIPLARDDENPEVLPGGKRTDHSPYGSSPAYFKHELGQGPAGRTVDPTVWKAVPFHSLGWVNPSFGRRLGASDGVPAAYVGSPDRPFPWIVWNDRPFANPYELVHVPRTAPGRLFTNYRSLDFPFGDDYQPLGVATPPSQRARYRAADMFGACTPGAHLLPLTSITDVAPPGASRARHADLFVRLFEFVRVRSPFNGADTYVGNAIPPGGTMPARFCGPFGRVSAYRDPGGINVNTISASTAPEADGAPIWNAICGTGASPATPTWRTIVDARTISAGSATYRRPYRPAFGDGANFSEEQVPGGQSNTLIPQGWIDALRAEGSDFKFGDRFTARSFTLFTDGQRTPIRESLFAAPAATSWATDGERDAWFRLETLVRANAHTTVRSEVYAIWVTMGLFEVQPGNGGISMQYPDGWQLVREYGSDTGNTTRHRSFFIFDRSTPVAYEPGVDHNVRDAIPIERFIE
jgi:hypothetical protein